MKHKAYDLLDHCETVTTITCSKCGKKDEIDDDSFESVDTFFEDGWRATPSNCYCPECAKKKLKTV